MELVIIIWLLCAALGFAVAGEGRKPAGAALGALLGPLGVLFAAFLK